MLQIIQQLSQDAPANYEAELYTADVLNNLFRAFKKLYSFSKSLAFTYQIRDNTPLAKLFVAINQLDNNANSQTIREAIAATQINIDRRLIHTVPQSLSTSLQASLLVSPRIHGRGFFQKGARSQMRLVEEDLDDHLTPLLDHKLEP